MCYALSNLGYNVDFVVPDRLKDGYGMQTETIKKHIEEKGTSLIITVDNGISAKSLVEMANEKGVQVIITDHHLPDEETVPQTLIIDPKYNNDDESDICGAFVALKLVYALYYKVAPDKFWVIERLFPLAGIATITDMMLMQGENRVLVSLMLEHLNKIKYCSQEPYYKILFSLGGQSFFKSPISVATEELISFYIGPSINAVSRVNGVVDKLIEDILRCLSYQYAYMPSYNSFNYARRNITNELFDDYVYDPNYKNSSVFIFNQANYSSPIKGVIGLVANKLSNEKHISTLIGCETEEGVIDFSGRSTSNYNLYEGMQRIKTAHPEFEIKGGGHSQAMGFKIKNDPVIIAEFKDCFENDIIEHSEPYEENTYLFEPELEDEIIKTLYELQPYGNGFRTLKFKYKGTFYNYDQEARLASIGEYQFRMFTNFAEIERQLGMEIEVIFTISFAASNGAIFSIVKE